MPHPDVPSPSDPNPVLEIAADTGSPRLAVKAVDAFNYAAWQNAVPLLRSVAINNSHGEELASLIVELSASPAFLRTKRWIIDRVNAGETLTLRDVDIDIDPAYLNRLDEAERGVLTFQLKRNGNVLHETTHVLRVLARDEWGGMSAMGELLPAFVTPNDPALAPLLKSTATVLGDHCHSMALDGYQSGDPNRSYLLAAALWSAVAARSLTYANPPGSFEREGQKTRRVSTVLNDGLATCLDSTLLFASGLEALGLNPVIVMTKGHCFAGVWLVEKSFNRLVEPDCSEVRKAIAARELVVFETTLITRRPPAQFPDAVSTAACAVSEQREDEFVAAIDVARARMSQIRPLASHSERIEEALDDADAAPIPLPAPPGFDRLPPDEVEERPRTPAGRIERWQRKLLDLSLRNRLLNFRLSLQTVPVLCPDVSRLEDRLADGARMRLISLMDANPLAQRDADLHHQRTQKDLEWEFARQALDRDEIACPVNGRELDQRLTALFRKVRNDLAEGGSNTLYLAVGFLRWKRNPEDESTYRAPLLLVPVKLTRRSASSPFYLTNHEDDVRFNATLLQLLKKDFDCDLTELEFNLPMDDSGVDVPRLLNRIRQAVRDVPGFEVVEEAAIAPFSFAKYLMWKDLVDRVGRLEHNRLVRHLIHDPDKPFVTDAERSMPRPVEIDLRYAPEDIVHPLPADSSQLAAVMAAAEGHDMVIIGPPGTGKSQTIANLIAQCLAVGKTVLFVAEKTAALDVVHRRLREHGLGDCCVELHSNKAERRRFLEQLQASWRNRSGGDDSEWVEINERLRVRRDQLNAYAAAVHRSEANGWTPYRAMGELVRGRHITTPPLNWPRAVRHDRAKYAELESAVATLATMFEAVPANTEILRVEATEWSTAWETGFLDACHQLVNAAQSLAAALEQFSKLSQSTSLVDASFDQMAPLYRLAQELERPELPPEELLQRLDLDWLEEALDERSKLLQESAEAKSALDAALLQLGELLGASLGSEFPEEMRRPYYELARELVSSSGAPAELVFHGDFEAVVKAIADRPALLQACEQAFEAIQGRRYNSSLIDRLGIDRLEREWNAAQSSFWPLSVWRSNKVKRKLTACMIAGGVVEPELDVPLLREYQDCRDRLKENLASTGLPPRMRADVERDPAALDSKLEPARRLRDAILRAGLSPELVGKASRGSLKPLISAASRLFPLAKKFETLRRELKENLAALALSADLQAVVKSDASALDSQIQSSQTLRQSLISLGISNESLPSTLSSLVVAPQQIRLEAAGQCRRSVESFKQAWIAYTTFAETPPVASESKSIIEDASAQAQNILAHRTALRPWIAWGATKKRAAHLGLSAFVEALQSGELNPADAVARFQLAYARWWLPTVVDEREPLRLFQKLLHENAIEEFRQLDDAARRAAAPRVQQATLHGLPPSDRVPRKSELGLLRHQMTLKRPSKSIREIISGMPETFAKLAPCLLMSPLSIAQYLPADQALFDVIVFDEASQIATWDAIGAIARGKQTIIVGDPKQLPPTNFFGRTDNDEENSELEDHEKDLESILDEARASGLPTLQLNWHYRSRHESLIAFSNYQYYGNNLVTFPAAESIDRGISLKYIKDGRYDRGKSRTNRHEAEAIVADAVARMKRCLKKPEMQRLTYGVVTFNSQQQALIQDLFDEALRKHPELEWFFSDERFEPTAVKNLENVQGDERDVMMFSITFGFDAAGKFPIDFGAINRDGGERRLNVAVTRARQELVVYASFLPDQLRAERSSARGVHDLKAFLEYAEKGPEAIIRRTDGPLGEHESPLEEAIAAALRDRGWQVDPQVGVSGFRIDLGIVHPDKPGAYLAAVECDGATYHRSAVARDRDKTRQQILENLGWTIIRAWSTDWWYDPESALAQIDGALTELLQRSREEPQQSSGESPVPPSGEVSRGAAPDQNELPDEPNALDTPPPRDPPSALAAPHQAEPATGAAPPQLVGRQAAQQNCCYYSLIDLGDASAHQSRFFDDDYTDILRNMALSVLKSHGPIRDDVLAREVARAHGFARTGNRIKQRVLDLLPHVVTTDESVGRFLWPGQSVEEWVPFRYPLDPQERRNIDEIAIQELIGLARAHGGFSTSEDPALSLARELGVARLSRSARERLEMALDACMNDT